MMLIMIYDSAVSCCAHAFMLVGGGGRGALGLGFDPGSVSRLTQTPSVICPLNNLNNSPPVAILDTTCASSVLLHFPARGAQDHDARIWRDFLLTSAVGSSGERCAMSISLNPRSTCSS
jgi:hypothetical protein